MSFEPVVIVQARIESQRLPHKVIQPVLGQAMLLWQLYRLKMIKHPHTLVVAVPATEQSRMGLMPLLKRHGYDVVAPQSLAPVQGAYGREIEDWDVLSRFMAVASLFCNAHSTIVRITGDCPLIDPGVIDDLLDFYDSPHGWLAYAALANEWPDGLDVEVFSYSALATAHREAENRADREHVTPFIWRDKNRFNQDVMPCPFDLSEHCWSVDEVYDLDMVRYLIEVLATGVGLDFTWQDVWMAVCSHDTSLEWARGRRRNEGYMEQIADELPPCSAWEDLRYGGGIDDSGPGDDEDESVTGSSSEE